MHYALVDGELTEPSPKLIGTCKSCQAVMISKCGKHVIWHWAHKNRIHCDPWWEPETAWHRAWKNHFPKEWQEAIQYDPVAGEKHIADIKALDGRVVEFQHSAMKPEELKSREEYYKDMVWVIDGCRNELDLAHFNMGLGERHDPPNHPTIFGFEWYSRSKLFENWWSANCPVFIDFGHPVVWRLALYDTKKKRGVVGPIPKEDFIQMIFNGSPMAKLSAIA